MTIFKAKPDKNIQQHGMPFTGNVANEIKEAVVEAPVVEEVKVEKQFEEMQVLTPEEIEKRNKKKDIIPAMIGTEFIIHPKTAEKFKKKKENKE